MSCVSRFTSLGKTYTIMHTERLWLQPNGSVSDGLMLMVFTFECNLMTPDLPPWHTGGKPLIQFVRLQRKTREVSCFCENSSLGEMLLCPLSFRLVVWLGVQGAPQSGSWGIFKAKHFTAYWNIFLKLRKYFSFFTKTTLNKNEKVKTVGNKMIVHYKDHSNTKSMNIF